MLCKAAAMGDYDAYDRILAATSPPEAKALGRGVHPWDQARWDALVCGVGASVVRAKFAGVPGLAKLLRATVTLTLTPTPTLTLTLTLTLTRTRTLTRATRCSRRPPATTRSGAWGSTWATPHWLTHAAGAVPTCWAGA